MNCVTFEAVDEFRAALNVSTDGNSRDLRLHQGEQLDVHLTWSKSQDVCDTYPPHTAESKFDQNEFLIDALAAGSSWV